MHETPDDLQQLQQLLDTSYAAAGPHLHEVITPERRLTAEQLAATLTGMRLLVLATATKDGRPIAGPVDSIFYRGSFYFGSSPESVRFKHIAARPWVSATHLPGEELSVTVHGRAASVDLKSATRPVSGTPSSTCTSPCTASPGRPSWTPARSTPASTPIACSRSRCHRPRAGAGARGRRSASPPGPTSGRGSRSRCRRRRPPGRTRRRGPGARRARACPRCRSVPVAGDGHASRTNQHSRGFGRRRQLEACCAARARPSGTSRWRRSRCRRGCRRTTGARVPPSGGAIR